MSLWRWGGVQVRLHMLFLLFAAFTLYLSWLSQQGQGTADLVWKAAGSLGLLFLSVLLHELGHLTVALRLGGTAEEIVIGPLGGLSSMRVPREPRGELLLHLAGPAVNLLLCTASGTILFAIAEPDFLGLLHPLAPGNLVEGDRLRVGFKLFFWINWVLLLANLLPAYPFDGGRALRAALSALNPDESPQRSTALVARVAKITAVGLLVAAWICRRDNANQLLPLWFSLTLLAIFLYFSAKQEQERPRESEMDEQLFGYDFSQGFTSLERSSARQDPQIGFVTRWLEQRRQTRLQQRQVTEAEEERRVDEILVRLHEHGLESLSNDDRALLKRVSARYRQRNSGQTS